MEAHKLLAAVRAASGLTQEALARRVGTSQSTLSAYERGKKSPTLAVTDRILHVLGYELDVVPRVTFTRHDLGVGGRVYYLPDQLWRLSPIEAFTAVTRTKKPGRKTGTTDPRDERAATYIALLEHATPDELLAHVDGVLLVDSWPEIAPHLHPAVRDAWTPLIWDALTAGNDAILIEGVRSALGQQSGHAGRVARLRAVRRTAELGVPYENIAKILAGRRGQEVDDQSLALYRRRRRVKAPQREVVQPPPTSSEP